MALVATSLGAFVGAAVIGIPALFVVAAFPCEELGCLGVAILALGAALVGAAVGSALGCWAALRLRHAPRAGLTAWVLLGLWVALWAVIALVANLRIEFLDVGGTVAILLLHLGLPSAARWLVMRRGRNLTTRQISSPD